jgi:preprotein translocase subunit SecG
VKFLLLALYYSVCIFLIVVVLLQHGKGADIGVSLGAGSSNTVFGARGAGNFLTKLTTGCAILFMILAFSLARCAPETSSEDLLAAPPAAEAPAADKAPAAETPAQGEAKPPAPGETPEGFEAVEPPKPAAPAPAPAQPAKP